MASVITFQDLFPSSTVMRQYAGNGVISFPGAGDARLVAPNSLNCQFAYTNAMAPLVYERLMQMWQRATTSQPFYVETKLSYFTGTTNLRIAGLAIFTTPLLGTPVSFYSYQLGWYKNDAKIHVWYDTPSAESEIVTAVAAADPVSTPNLFRIYWNPYNEPLYIPELNITLQGDYLCFAFSTNAGSTWTNLGTRLRDFSFENAYVGLYCRKWETSAVNAQADFEYFKALQFNAADFPQIPESKGEGQQKLALEDAYAILNESGPARFDSPDGIKGAVTLNEGPRLGLEDAYSLPAVTGKDVRFDLPELKADLTIPKDTLGLEESVFVQLDATDYIKGKYDTDGREFLGGTGVRHIFYYDATLDPWHTHGAGFYGAGRNGKLYYDGVECAPGDFGTVASGYRRTAWAFPDGFVDRDVISKAAQISMPADGTLRFTVNTNGTDIASSLRWFFTGDFDVQVDYNIVSNGSGPSDGGLALQAVMDWNNYTYVRRRMFGSGSPNWDKDVRNNGSYVSYASVGGATVSGKLRITRVGSTVTSYYWTGSAWAAIGSGYAMTYNRPMYIDLGFWFNSTPTGTVFEFSNFVINSGSTTNLVGWAREAAGTYRGSLAEFPQHALLVSSGNGFDIIDADTNKLWMSFRSGTNNLVGGDGNYYIRQVSVRDGTLLVAYRTFDSYGIVDGWVAWIDFTLDFVRLHRGPSYNDAGLIYNIELTTGMWPIWSPNGCIAFRNTGRAFFASHYDNWQFQNSRANWVDLLNYLGYQYRFVANNGGTYLSKWKRWRLQGTSNEHLDTPDYGSSTQTGAMQWVHVRSASRDLLYHDRTTLFITHYATWQAVIGGGGGTWVEDHAYLLAGTRDPYALGTQAQDAMDVDDAGDKLYYARNEGVYVMDLTTGVSTLIYGKPGSGATYAILPDYASISSVKLLTDGATPLLVVGMARPDRSWAVNRTTHTVYWKGFLDDAHQPFSLAVGA
jgi:hypothetical protein